MAEPENLEDYPNRMAELFAHKTILVTGGTGFVGKVFIEKVLRTCSEIKKIYLLIRTKKDKDPNTRLKQVFQEPVFDLLRKQNEDIFSRVQAVSGDISSPDLDLSCDDREILTDEVQMIFNCAATVRFDETLQRAVFVNVRGTKLMLDLAKQCKDLLVFVHISTAYCHLHERVLYEKAYPPPADPHKVITACEWLEESTLESITKKILGDIPNTYSYSKALGEALVSDEIDNLPVMILRPSVIVPIWQEPLPGWTDNINGPMGLLIGAGKGVIRTMYCRPDTYSDYVPVDIVANGIIFATFHFTKTQKRIFNVTSSSQIKLTFQEVLDLGRNIIETKLPLNWVMWYPGGSIKQNRLLHYIDFILFQLIPAIFLDALLILLRYKPVLLKVQKRVFNGYAIFEYYANRQWDFNNDESLKALETLNPKERRIYKLDSEGLDYDDFFYKCIHAARLYILKESDESIPTAKRHMKIMWFADRICKFLFIIGLLYFLYTRYVKQIL